MSSNVTLPVVSCTFLKILYDEMYFGCSRIQQFWNSITTVSNTSSLGKLMLLFHEMVSYGIGLNSIAHPMLSTTMMAPFDRPDRRSAPVYPYIVSIGGSYVGTFQQCRIL